MIKAKIFLLLFLSAHILHSQQTEAASGAYLIPRQIFVGDPATLVLPLSSAPGTDDVVLSQSDYLPKDPHIDFHRIILERRAVGSRLMIEFTPFIPGTVELPVIEIAGEYFSGLSVTVNSIINERSSPVLSGPASALAIPGTALMLYGSLTLIVFLIILSILFILRGQTLLKKLIEKIKRQRLFSTIRKTEKRLRKALYKNEDKRLIIDKLSDEFRIFLSCLTGNNCRSMTALEFEQKESENNICSLFLGKYFRDCDGIRFSGIKIVSGDIIRLLDDLKHFVDSLENPPEEKTA
ncbi:MAG: hypothetical protein FWD26_09100 [Treponema sp.]|nr:hypothetical protein [Treponema sp.]